MDVRPQIREARLELGLSLREVADLCAISYESVRRIESATQWPSYETAIKLVDGLDLRMDPVDLIHPASRDSLRQSVAHIFSLDL